MGIAPEKVRKGEDKAVEEEERVNSVRLAATKPGINAQ